MLLFPSFQISIALAPGFADLHAQGKIAVAERVVQDHAEHILSHFTDLFLI